jgi:hypothetical protein
MLQPLHLFLQVLDQAGQLRRLAEPRAQLQDGFAGRELDLLRWGIQQLAQPFGCPAGQLRQLPDRGRKQLASDPGHLCPERWLLQPPVNRALGNAGPGRRVLHGPAGRQAQGYGVPSAFALRSDVF